MKKVMTYETLRSYAYSNDHLINGEIKGIVVEFFGLGSTTVHKTDNGDALEYAEKGIVYIIPYNNPWNWMNAQAVAYTDEIIDVICEHYGLGDDVKVVSTGGSMGGLSSLVYTVYAKRTPVACVANCPVCDFPFHYTERPDLPRTIYSSIFNEEGELEEVLRRRSPLHLVDRMPRVPYTVFHCERDASVNINAHSIPFVEAMQKAGQDITFIRIPHRPHCNLTPAAWMQYRAAVLKAIEG